MATSPEKNATTIPMTTQYHGMDMTNPPLARSIISTIAEPKIMGIDNKNEKLDAVFLSTPRKVKVEIVAPLLDTPGSTAIPCKTPVNNAF